MFLYSKLLQGNILKVCPAVKFKISSKLKLKCTGNLKVLQPLNCSLKLRKITNI